MLYSIITLGFLACGDEATKTEEKIPTPPTEVKTEEVKTEEAKTEEVKPETQTAAQTAPSEGTTPSTQPDNQLIATTEIKVAKSNLLADAVEKQLLADAKAKGFDGIKDFKLIKNECNASGCTGIGQANAYKTTVTYAVGNAVVVTQADKTKKNGLITAIENDKYTVSYDDNSNATVEKSALSPR